LIPCRAHHLLAPTAALAVVFVLAGGAAAAVRAQEAAPADTAAAPAAPEQPAPAEVDSATVHRINPDLVGFDSARPDFWRTGVSPTGAVLMTPLFPGWGQLYAENGWRAGLAYGVQMYFWTNMISRDRRARRSRDFATTFAEDDPNRALYNANAEEQWAQMRDFAWWSGGTLLIIALDAYVGAHLFDFGEDPVPVPDQWQREFGGGVDDRPGVALAPTYTVFRWRMTF